MSEIPLIHIPDGLSGESLVMTKRDAQLLQLELRAIQAVLEKIFMEIPSR